MRKILLLVLGLMFGAQANAQFFFQFEENNLTNCCLPEKPNIKPTNPDTAKAAFRYLRDTLHFEYRYAYGSCEDRAHFVCKALAKKQVQSMKIWCFAPIRYTLISRKKLRAKDPLHIKDTITWTYHVASAIVTGQKDTLIVDLSLNDQKPLPYKKWLAALNCPEAAYTFTSDKMYLFNSLNGFKAWRNKTPDDTVTLDLPTWFPNIISGDFFTYDTSSHSIPQGMAVNDVAVLFFEKEKNNLPKDVLVKILGNINHITAFLEKDKTTKKITAEFKQTYQAYIDKYAPVYEERLRYWTRRYREFE